MSKTAILIDGAFIKQKFKQKHKRNIKPEDIIGHCNEIMVSEPFNNDELFRIYYYDCVPYMGKVKNPIHEVETDCSETEVALLQNKFLEDIALQPKIALRKGRLAFRGWRLPHEMEKEFIKQLKMGEEIDPDELKMSYKEKQVDMEIGLDIAWLSSKSIVDKIVLITADSDFVPAMKFARREGVRVYLNHLENPVNKDLKIHADGVLSIDL